MRRVAAALCLFLAFSVSAQDDGERLYERKCSTCHGTDGRGGTSIGRKFGVRDLRSAVNGMTDQQIEEVVVNGRGQMPPTRKLDDADVAAITRYLRELVTRDAARSNAVAVERLYSQKCAGCHAHDGSGNIALGRTLKVPNLTSAAVKDKSDQQLADVIAKGKGKMPAFARRCTPAQIAALVGYLKSPPKQISKTAASKPESAPAAAQAAEPAQERSKPTRAREPPKLPIEAPAVQTSTATNSGALQAGEKPDSKSSAEAKPKTPPPARSKPTGIQQTYAAKCAACHSSDGSGQGTIGRTMNIRSFSSAEVQRKSDEELAVIIASGRGRMPAYAAKLTSEQIAQLVEYIRTLRRK